jgi:5-dehydro-2-deoxygluconokinase
MAEAGQTPFELITVGRVSVDLYPEQARLPLAEVRTFAKSLGGSPVNVAVAAARLGLRAATITKVGDDAFGPYVRAALAGFGVDARWVGTHPTLRTPVVFCELHPPDDFPLLFYREPQAPDMTIEADELDLDAIAAATVFWTTGTGLSAEPSRSATLAALERRRAANPAGITVHDLDHRPVFWAPGGQSGELAARALGSASVAVGNLEEVEMAVGTRDPRAAAERLLELGPATAVIKRGPGGVYALSADRELDLPPVRLEVVNGLGAGDAFGGALAFGLARGLELEEALTLANAAGAVVASRLACADAMPTPDELDALAAAPGAVE